MRKLKKTNIFTYIFLSSIFFFTIFSKDLYHFTLPKVLIAVVVDKQFPVSFTTEDGTLVNTETKMKAVPKTALYGESVFVLEEREDGLYLNSVDIALGEEKDGWVSFDGKIAKGTRIIIGADRKLEVGTKVLEVSSGGKNKKSD